MTTTLLFITIWFLAVPPAAALIAQDIAEEKIGTVFTSWIDLRFRGTLVAYLVRCPRCLSHWMVFLFSALSIPAWASMPFGWYMNSVMAVICTFAATRIARMWIS